MNIVICLNDNKCTDVSVLDSLSAKSLKGTLKNHIFIEVLYG